MRISQSGDLQLATTEQVQTREIDRAVATELALRESDLAMFTLADAYAQQREALALATANNVPLIATYPTGFAEPSYLTPGLPTIAQLADVPGLVSDRFQGSRNVADYAFPLVLGAIAWFVIWRIGKSDAGGVRTW